jgi:subtilisin family serine protease/subtilisin-like proprotein convertase family protein
MLLGPKTQVISQEQSATLQVTVKPVGGFSGNVALSVTSVPPIAAQLSATPSTIPANGTAIVTVATSTATAPGTYALTVAGTSGALTSSRTVTLQVRPRGTIDVVVSSTDTPRELDLSEGPYDYTTDLVEVRQFLTVSEVKIDVELTDTIPEVLDIRLRSPAGTELTVLARGDGVPAGDIRRLSTTISLPTEFRDQPAHGSWALKINDITMGGRLAGWKLHVSGLRSAPSFDVLPSPLSRTAIQGETARFPTDVPAFGAFPAPVELLATAAPSLAAAMTWSAASVPAPGASLLEIATTCSTAPGDYQVQLHGSGGGLSYSSPVALTVYPFGARARRWVARDTPLTIHDDGSATISELTIPEDLEIAELSADLHIAHPGIGDLHQVELITPSGVVIPILDSSRFERFHRRYPLLGLRGESTRGTWKLRVVDPFIDQQYGGQISGWALQGVATSKTHPPRARFASLVEGDRVSFSDQSEDPGCDQGAVTSWAWELGDGTTSTEREPSHRYQVASTYQVTLTVTDNDGLTSSVSQAVTTGAAVPKPDDDDGGCAASSGAGGGFAVALLFMLRRRRRRRAMAALAAAMVVVISGCSSDDVDGLSGTKGQHAGESLAVESSALLTPHAPHSVIVRFKPGFRGNQVGALVSSVHGSFQDHNRDGIDDRFTNLELGGGHLAKITLAPATLTVAQALDTLRADPSVEYAEPDYLVDPLAVPNEARFAEQYGLHNTGQNRGAPDADIDAVEAWEVSTGSRDVVVGVIDSGIDYSHKDLAANMWQNLNEIPGNHIDDDNNGVIDDRHGFNAYANNGIPLDDLSHGTHCAGIIGAVGNNTLGVVGVNWQTSLMALKFLNEIGGGQFSDAISAINYAVGRKRAGVNLRVLSASWGSSGNSLALRDAIAAAGDADLLFVAAAGNSVSNNDLSPVYPASYDLPNVLAVAATDRRDALSTTFSNFGLTSVDVAAPGVDILSTVIGSSYRTQSGTSMSAPLVAGAAALVLAVNSSLTVEELKAILMNTGDAKQTLVGTTVSGRRVNVANAIAAAAAVGPRFALRATPAARQLVLQGQTTTFQLEVTAQAGFTGDVGLAVTSTPPLNGSVVAAPASLPGGGAATVTVTPTVATAPGLYALTVTATSGAITRSRPLALRVLAADMVAPVERSLDTPRPIPDGTRKVTSSIIDVQQNLLISEGQIELSLLHTAPPSLRVSLLSPAGTRVVLQERGTYPLTLGVTQYSYPLPAPLLNQPAAGPWTLTVEDFSPRGNGEIVDWNLALIGPAGAPAFGVVATPSQQVVRQGESTSFAISMPAFSGFSGTVALTAALEPAPSSGAVVTPPVTPAPGTATVGVSASCSTPPGRHPLTITGQSGELVRTARASVTVQPFATTWLRPTSSDPPVWIPRDGQPAVAAIEVTEDLAISEAIVDVLVFHLAPDVLRLVMVAPDGRELVLHDQTNGPSKLARSFSLRGVGGMRTKGTWRLLATDITGLPVGRIESFALRLAAAPRYLLPQADFSVEVDASTAVLTDASRDQGCGQGTLTSWLWDFGDGTTSAEPSPRHRYAGEGTYTVTLTVSNDGGLSHSTSQQVTIEDGSSGGCATGGMGGNGGWLVLVLVLWGSVRRRPRGSRSPIERSAS